MNPRILAATALASLLTLLAPARADDHATVREAVSRIAPGVPIAAMRDAPLAGLVEVQVGARVLYVSADGRHVLEGTLTDATSGRDLTEASRSERRRQILSDLPADAKIAFAPAPPHAPAHRVTVFTAVDCGFCRRFHDGIDEYLAQGIAVDYVMIALGGRDSPAERASRAVYCAADRQAAFTAATKGQSAASPSCTSSYPLAVATAAMLGISRTPTIVAANGEIVGGFLSPAQLRERLDAQP
jgi:thiol:disulfide interchange protein DsbC